jgi:threonyl-tRNA synthetase
MASHPVSSSSEPIRGAEVSASAAKSAVPPPSQVEAAQKGADGAPKEAKEGKEKPQGQKKKDKKAGGGGGGAGPLELSPPPEYFAERIKIYDEYKAKYDKWVAGMSRPLLLTFWPMDGNELRLICRTTKRQDHSHPPGRQAGRGYSLGDYTSADRS